MQKKLQLLIILILIVRISPGIAQQDKQQIELEAVPIPSMLLPYNNPMMTDDDAFVYEDQPTRQELSAYQKDVMSHIAGIYRLNVKAIEAQIQNDALGAEKYI